MSLHTAILDWCFPPRADELLVRALDASALTVEPRSLQNGVTCLLPFYNPTVQALIHEAKFFHNQRAHRLLGAVLTTHLHKQLPAYLIPIPLHSSRERERGFNQVSACLNTQPMLGKHQQTNLLKRTVKTQPQSRLPAAARHENVRNAFSVNLAALYTFEPERPIIIIDDVHTTGATMQAARTALQTAAPNHTIYGLAMAYA